MRAHAWNTSYGYIIQSKDHKASYTNDQETKDAPKLMERADRARDLSDK